jgi:hypothetical protein
VRQKGIPCDVKFILGINDKLSNNFWKFLPIWIERNWLGVSEFMVVHGLDAEKINQVLDSYRDGSRVSPVGSP